MPGRDGQRRAFTPAVILFIALPEAEDKADPGGMRSRWRSCRDGVRGAVMRPSSAMANGANRPTMSATTGFGSGAVCAGRVARPSTSCPPGHRRTASTAFAAGNKPGNRNATAAAVGNNPRRRRKTRIDCQIRPRYGAGPKLISGFCRLARWWVGVGRSLVAFRAEQILQGSDDGAAFFLGRRLNDTGEPCEGLRTTLILGTMGKLAHNHRRSQGPLPTVVRRFDGRVVPRLCRRKPTGDTKKMRLSPYGLLMALVAANLHPIRYTEGVTPRLRWSES